MTAAISLRRSLLPALAAALLLTSCGGETTTEDSSGPEPTTYTVRGRIVAVPDVAGGEIQIEHEAIHELVDFRGDVVGMDAMTMFFPVAEGAASEEIAAGDIIEFDLLVDWNADPLSTVTRIAKLPADTELVFGRAEPPAE